MLNYTAADETETPQVCCAVNTRGIWDNIQNNLNKKQWLFHRKNESKTNFAFDF